MRKISEKRVKGHMRGRGKYGISMTYKGKRGLANQTFRTKKKAEAVLKYAKTCPQYKNPRLVQLK